MLPNHSAKYGASSGTCWWRNGFKEEGLIRFAVSKHINDHHHMRIGAIVGGDDDACWALSFHEVVPSSLGCDMICGVPAMSAAMGALWAGSQDSCRSGHGSGSLWLVEWPKRGRLVGACRGLCA